MEPNVIKWTQTLAGRGLRPKADVLPLLRVGNIVRSTFRKMLRCPLVVSSTTVYMLSPVETNLGLYHEEADRVAVTNKALVSYLICMCLGRASLMLRSLKEQVAACNATL